MTSPTQFHVAPVRPVDPAVRPESACADPRLRRSQLGDPGDWKAIVEGFRSPLAASFVDDWSVLRSDRSTTRRLRTWDLGPGTTAPLSIDEVLVRTGFMGSFDDAAQDLALMHVVRIAADDLLAARVVLQRLLPGLVSIARRRGGNRWGVQQQSFDDLVAHSWLTIRTFPVERRSKHLAGNLLRDIEYATFVRPIRLKSATEAPRSPDEVPTIDVGINGRMDSARSSFEQLVEVIIDGRDGGLAEADLRLVLRMASGVPVEQMAAERGISTRALLPHRKKAIENLRNIVAQAA